jgi:O-antigen/teichoic acid export membrane protein
MLRDALAIARRYLMSLGGEGFQSAFHFALGILLIRLLTPYDYGVFAIVFILGGLSLTYGNALVSIPANVHIARVKSERIANFHDVVFGSVALVICGVLALIVTGGLWVAIGSAGEAWAGGAFVGLWTIRNHLRNVLFARGAMNVTLVADFSYAAGGALLNLMLYLLRPELIQATTVLVVLAVANLLGIVVAFFAAGRVLARRRFRLSLGRSVRRRYQSVWPDIGWSLIWVTTWNIQGQGLMFLVAAIVGAAAYAPIAAGLILFAPLRLAAGAFDNVARPNFAAALAVQRYQFVTIALFSSLALLLVGCLTYGALILFAWPLLMTHIYGEKFAQAALPLIVTLAFINAVTFVSYNPPLALLQALGRFKAVAVATAVGGIVGISLVALLLEVSSPAWSLAGAATGEAAALMLLWPAALSSLRPGRCAA